MKRTKKPPSCANDEIAAILKKRAALDERLARAKVKKQQADARNATREAITIGEAVVRFSEDNAEFKLMLTQVLPTAITQEASRDFLRGRGWAL